MSSVLSNNVNSLILPDYTLSQFAPPTNKASSTTYSTSYASNGSSTCVETNTTNGNTSLPTFPAPYSHVPFLPVSKGNIKKLAQTRFVNSSPKSYRLMPASVESSESDRTSFVEKTSHKFFLPVTYFLEVAKLWEVSNRSELECHFTIANNKEEFKTTPSVLSDEHTSQHRQRPICHARPIPAKLWGSSKTTLKRQRNENSVEAEKDLLRSVNRFLGSCRTKDKISASMSGISTSSTNVGSETRRYLSQIVSLMSRKFAARLVNQQNDFDSNRKTTEFPAQDDVYKLDKLNQMHLCENKRGCIEDQKQRHHPLDVGKGRKDQRDNDISHPDQKIEDFLPSSKHHELNLSLDPDQKMVVVDPTSQDQSEDYLHLDPKMVDSDTDSQDHGKDVASDLDHKMEDSDPKEDMNDRQVKIFSMSSEDAVGEADEHLLIIHINKNQTNGRDRDKSDCDDEPSHKRRRTNSEPMSAMASNAKNVMEEHVVSTVGVGTPDTNTSSYKCFYCQVRCNKRIDCARHMLSHLPS